MALTGGEAKTYLSLEWDQKNQKLLTAAKIQIDNSNHFNWIQFDGVSFHKVN